MSDTAVDRIVSRRMVTRAEKRAATLELIAEQIRSGELVIRKLTAKDVRRLEAAKARRLGQPS
jgi:U3 small nucleolar RNA-associated protein 14